MSSSWQHVEIPLTGGLYEKAQPEDQPFGTFARLENLEHRRDGALQKRRGVASRTKAVLGGGTINSGARLLTRRDALLLIGTDSASTGTYLYSYADDAGAWIRHGRVPPCAVEREPVVGVGARPDFWDTAYTNGFYADMWTVGPAMNARVTSATTGNVVLDASLGIHAVTAKICAVGNFFFLTYNDPLVNAAHLRYYRLDTTNISAGWVSGGALPNCTDLAAATTFDTWGTATRLYVAYTANVVGDQISIRSYDTTPTQISAKTGYAPHGGGNTIVGLGLDGSGGDRLWVGSCFVDTHVIGLDLTTLTTVLSTDAAVMTGNHGNLVSILGYGAGVGHILIAGSHGTSQSFWITFDGSSGAVSTTGYQQVSAYRMCPMTRAFRSGGRTYIFVMDVSATAGQSPQSMMALVDVTDTASSPVTAQMPIPVACPAPRIGVLPGLLWKPASSAGRQGLAHVAVDQVTTSVLVGVLKSTATGTGAGAANSLDRVRFDFGSPFRWMGGELGEAVVLGPQPYNFDGAHVVECGYWTSPNQPTVNSVGGTLAAGSYVFVAIYECVHGSGLIEWSSPSPPATAFVADGSHNASVVVQTLQVTAKDQNVTLNALPVRIVLYASKDGGAYQRVTGSETMNAPASDTVTIAVSAVDPSAPGLYTTPGAAAGSAPMARQIPPPLSSIVVHGDRYAGVDETGKNVWFSGQYIYGELPWFSSAFQFPIEQGRPIIGLGSLDGALYALKRDRVFVIAGDGPADNGAGFYGLPVELPVGGAGCTEPRSIVSTPDGLFFMSEQGIYAVSRGGEAQFIGKGVERTTFTNPIITSAIVHQATAKVHFTCTDSSGLNGRRPSFDMVHKTWTMDRPAPGGTDLSFVSAIMTGGALGFTESLFFTTQELWAGLTADGTVYSEGPFLDAGQWQTSYLQTGWIPFDGRQGYQRVCFVQLLLEQATGHDLTIQLAYDYNSTIVDTVTFTAAQIAGYISGGFPEQLGIECSRQKIEALQITVFDATPSSGSIGIGKGSIFLGFEMQMRVKGALYRLPPAQTQ